MSKAIKWQIPFASLSGTLYRIDIYAEGYSGDPIQLTAGESPFVTEEDSSEDFFAPIRTQTGSIQVCTRKPDCTMLTLDEILPANNIDHPVRLLNISDPSNPIIEWQGFLSCEAYSQNYTAIPENLTLSVISVLEAMDSVQLDQTHSTGLTTIKGAIKLALEEIRLQSGMSLYDYVNYSGSSYRIFNKYIDQTVFFERKEYNNENSTTYIVSGISVKDVLSRLATYMGWSVREQGRTLYFERIGGDIYTWTDTYAQFGGVNPSVQQVALSESAIANFDWMGTDHKRDIRQGAKSVEVVARVDGYDLDMGLLEFPAGNVSTYYNEMNNNVTSEFWSKKWWYMVASQNTNAYSNLKLGYWSLQKSSNGDYNCRNYAQSNLSNVLAHMLQAMSDSTARKGAYAQTTPLTYHAGAFFAKEAFEDSETQTHQPDEGLHCVFVPYTIANTAGSSTPPNFDPSQVGYIMQMSSVTSFWANSGYLNLNADYEMMYWHWADQGTHLALGSEDSHDWKCGMRLQFGNKYWNGSSWQTTPCLFEAVFNGGNFKGNWDYTMGILETDGLLIPIPSSIGGEVILEIWPNVSDLLNVFKWWVFEAFFKKLNLDYIPIVDDTLTDRSENHYFRLLGTNFRDEISVGTDLASSLNNQPSPSLIMEDSAGTTPMTELEYTVKSGNTYVSESRRPEVDLLNRLASYYGASRQTLDLITKHPTEAALPLLKLNGINDGKQYLPLSESRDWREETCTIKCFEMPGTPSES